MLGGFWKKDESIDLRWRTEENGGVQRKEEVEKKRELVTQSGFTG